MRNLLVPIKAVIADIKEETCDVKTYAIATDTDRFKDFSPGQFNMVGLPGAGEAPISLSSLATGDTVYHTIRSVGRLTGYMDKLVMGDEVFLRGPYGRGWPIEDIRNGDLLIVGGGLGIATLRPVIQTILQERNTFGNVTLAYGARDPLNVIYSDEFEKWRGGIDVLLTVDEAPEGSRWPHHRGLVTELIERADINTSNACAFICGPEIMMRFVARKLLHEGFPPAKIFVSLERRMRCGIGQCGHCQHGSEFVCRDGPVFRHQDVSSFPDGLL